MNVTVERIADSQVRLLITADQEEHDKAVEKAYRRLSKDINVPGFRKGKAPRTMIERVYGREVFVEEANRDLIDILYRQAIEQEELLPVGSPDLESIEPEPLSFVVVVPVYPTVDPGDYEAVRVEPVDATIDDSAIDELLEQLRLTHSPWVDPATERNPKEGDQVTLDIQIMDGDEEFQPTNEDAVFVLGESNLLDELRGTIDALKPGESASTDILFAEDDERYAENDPRRGKTMTYNVTLKGIKERDLLPLDDDFAQTYADSETLAGLRERIHANLHSERTREARTEAVNAILEKINEAATLDIPPSMVDDSVEERIARLRSRLQYSGVSLDAYLRQTNQDEDQLKEEIRPAVERDLRTSIILREIANREEIEITDSDIEAEVEAIASQAPEAEEMREAYLQNAYLRSALRNELYDQRLTDRLIEIATEGKGAVTNAYVAPDLEEDEETSESSESEDEGEAETAGDGETAESIEADEARLGFASREAENGMVPGDGAADCPEGYPVKGNADSMIFHVETDATYERTIPEFCFATTEAAEAAGYRPTVRRSEAES